MSGKFSNNRIASNYNRIYSNSLQVLHLDVLQTGGTDIAFRSYFVPVSCQQPTGIITAQKVLTIVGILSENSIPPPPLSFVDRVCIIIKMFWIIDGGSINI